VEILTGNAQNKSEEPKIENKQPKNIEEIKQNF